MLAILSPAKSLNFDPPPAKLEHTQPEFADDSQELIDLLRTKSARQLEKLMKISANLAELNRDRYHEWSLPFTTDNAKQALLAFQGDVYQGFELDTFKKADFTFAQQHLRILSGLYGLLRPLDLIQAYRLEMGTALRNDRGRDLYAFWGDQITDALNTAIARQRGADLINLASNEYFKSVRPNRLNATVYTPVFKERKDGKLRIISFFAKKARGMMADFMIRNRLKQVQDLQSFDTAGYAYDASLSDELTLTFTRDQPPKKT